MASGSSARLQREFFFVFETKKAEQERGDSDVCLTKSAADRAVGFLSEEEAEKYRLELIAQLREYGC